MRDATFFRLIDRAYCCRGNIEDIDVDDAAVPAELSSILGECEVALRAAEAFEGADA